MFNSLYCTDAASDQSAQFALEKGLAVQIPTYSDPRFPVRWDCPKYDCYWGASFHTAEERDLWIERHPCSKTKRNYVMEETDEKGMPYTIPTHGKSVGEQLWDRLDDCVDAIKAPSGTDLVWVTAQADAYSQVLWLLQSYYYAELDDVKRQAMKRWKIRNNQIPWEPTPGYRYNPPQPGTAAWMKAMANQQLPRGATARKAAAPTRAPKPSPLSDAVIEAIRNGAQLGFTEADLAKAYNVPLSVIASLLENSG